MSQPSQPSLFAPLRYQPAFEQAEDGEADTEKELADTMRKIQETTLRDGGRPLRAVHAKSHGLLRGELQVFGKLPPHLAQGLFAHARTYPLVMRLSTVPGDILDDSVSTPRGMAIKIVGVDGERLPGSQGASTQDFVMVNGPAFLKKDGKSFLSSLKMLASTTDKAPGAKKILSAVLRGAEKVVESVGGESPTLISLGGHPQTHPLGDTYFSQTPFLYGDYMAKFSIAPVAPQLTILTGAKLDLSGHPNGLRDAVDSFFSRQSGMWELRVQLCTDLDAMPIEDAKTVWPEDRSPYVPVALIAVAPQAACDESRSGAIDEGLSFSPWHGLAAHRPLGSVNRMRRKAYDMARQFRGENNGRAMEEPSSVADMAA